MEPADGTEGSAAAPRAGSGAPPGAAADSITKSVHDGSYVRDPLAIAERFLVAIFLDNAPSRRQRPRRARARARAAPITAGR